jgi:hypothetical protein
MTPVRTVKNFALAVALAFVLSSAAATGTSGGSGLHGQVLIDPGYPICHVGVPCTRPARHARLTFRRQGRVVARTRTNDRGRYRVSLAPRTYRVSCSTRSGGKGDLTPQRVTVRRGRYRKVIFRLDLGIQ